MPTVNELEAAKKAAMAAGVLGGFRAEQVSIAVAAALDAAERVRTPFPPPPDIEPVDPPNPFAPIVFLERGFPLTWFARLGAVELGAVRAHQTGGPVQAYWSSHLPNGPRMRPATSIGIAKEKLAEHVREWFAACGIRLPSNTAKEGN
jgi:hypothetical protein